MRNFDNKRLIIICGIFILLTLIVISIALTLIMRANPDQNDSTKVTINGQIACLPKKASPATTECAIGLHADDNRYYALIDLPQKDWATGEHLSVTGTLTSGNYKDYATAGAIKITSFTKN